MPSLFSEIQNDILNPSSNITDILRKCSVLAYKINNDTFIKWTELELDGYDGDDAIPDYRIVGTVIRGDFSNRAGANHSALQIDKHLLPDFLQDSFGSGKVYYPVSYIESLLSYSADDDPVRDIPMSALPLFNRLYQGFFCTRAYEILPRMACYSVIDSIKNKTLRFLLEIEGKIENIEDIKLSKQDEKIVTQTFNNHIYGNANVANASENFNQNLQVQSHDLIDKLLSELLEIKKQGKDSQIIDDIIPHIESMKSVKDQTGVMTKLVEIMTIAGGSASVLSVITPYVSKLKELFI
ncbi:AbiTii domain-containing protein [Proteus columbae]|uniref:AbiTii domain-containing protein n=1 Tax=Proteus columbae TaxID=1987580 RepID=UPI000C1E7E71|nr:hypothetical protein [Proteus columbae]